MNELASILEKNPFFDRLILKSCALSLIVNGYLLEPFLKTNHLLELIDLLMDSIPDDLRNQIPGNAESNKIQDYLEIASIAEKCITVGNPKESYDWPAIKSKLMEIESQYGNADLIFFQAMQSIKKLI